MEYTLLRQMLHRISTDKNSLTQRLQGLADTSLINDRLHIVEQCKDNPEKCLDQLGITYKAPCDATRSGLDDFAMDCHLSVTVFEHIPNEVLLSIMKEARRTLRENGVAVHVIDMTDHFQHQDSSISRNHFLRYSNAEWMRIAGNEFAYTNRLKASDYIALFDQAGFALAKKITKIGGRDLLEGFPIHPDFKHYSEEDLLTTEMLVLLEKVAAGPAVASLGR